MPKSALLLALVVLLSFEAFAADPVVTLVVPIGGTTDKAQDTYSVTPGDTFNVMVVTVDPGYVFIGWLQDGTLVSTAAQLQLTITQDTTITAEFILGYTLTTSADGQGTISPPPGEHPYAANTDVLVTGTPNLHHKLWEAILDGDTANPVPLNTYDPVPDSVTMDADHSVEAIFSNYLLTLAETPGGDATIIDAATANSTINTPPDIGPHAFMPGEQTTLTATPSPQYAFDHWDEDGTRLNTNPLSVTMPSNNTTFTAIFTPTYTLTVTASPGGSGTVTPDPLPTGGVYLSGTVVTLTPNPVPGYVFDHWTGDLSGSANPGSITMNVDKTVTAVFVPVFTLTVNITGQGTVALSPPGGVYSDGTFVTLTANAAPGWQFDHWDGDLTSGLNPNFLTMSGNMTVLAVFSPTLTVNVTGQGSVALNPPGGVYAVGTPVTLTPNAATNWQFDHWEGDLTGSANPGQVTMNAPMTVTAVFTAYPVLTVEATTGPGTVLPSAGPHSYAPNTTAHLTITPDPGHHIAVVTVDGSPVQIDSTAPTDYPIQMGTTDRTVQVTFDWNLTIAVQSTDGASGTTTPPAGAYTYPPGSPVSLSATPNPDAAFDHWEEGGTNVGSAMPLQITVNSDLTVTAVFIPGYALTMQVAGLGAGPVSPTAGSHLYTPDTVVPITATPQTNQRILSTTLDGTPFTLTNPYNLTMDKAHTVAITFSDYLLTVAVQGDGVTTPAAGIYGYANGDNVSLTAAANPDSYFDHWDQDGTNLGNQQPLQLTITGNTTVTAVFLPEVSLTMSLVGHGTVIPSPGIHWYLPTDTVQITATPDANHEFLRAVIDGEPVEFDSNVQVTAPYPMEGANHTIQAVFTSWLVTLGVRTDGGAGVGQTNPPSPGTYPYEDGAPANIAVVDQPGLAFDHWEQDGTPIGNQRPLNVPITKDTTITAVFVPGNTLTIISDGQGTVSPLPGSYQYAANTQTFTITATPNPNHLLVRAILDGVSTELNSSAPIDLPITSMATNHTVEFVFTDYLATIAVNGDGQTNPPAGIYPHLAGDQITVAATANSGSAFNHWEQDGITEGYQSPLTVTVNKNTTVTAFFTLGYTLAITSQGQGSVSPPANNPVPYTEAPGTDVSVAITPYPGHKIVRVSYDGGTPVEVNSFNELDVDEIMNANHSIEAIFTQYFLTIGVQGQGTTTPSPGPYPYAAGDQATIDVVEQPGYIFSYWNQDGQNIGNQRPLTVTVNGDTSVTAVFIPGYHLTTAMQGQGTISPLPGTYGYAANTTVLVTATPNPGHNVARAIVDGALIDIGSPAPVSQPFTMDMDHSVDVIFTDYLVTLAVQGGGQTNPPSGTTYPFVAGDTATFDAVEQPGIVFSHWEQDGANIGDQRPLTFPVNANTTITAVFVAGYDLTVTAQGQGIVSPGPGVHGYTAGTQVPLVVTPNANHQIVSVTIDGIPQNITNPLAPFTSQITMGAAHSVQVVFTDYLLTLAIQQPLSGGATTPAPGTYAFQAGATATLNASDTGTSTEAFANWLQDGVNIGSQRPLSITMTADTAITAVFAPAHYLTITKNALGQGTVLPVAGVYKEAQGSQVVVTVTPSSPHQVLSLLLDGNPVSLSDTGTVTVTMNQEHELDVTFSEFLVTLAVVGDGTTTPAPGVHAVLSQPFTVQEQETPTSKFTQWTQDGTDMGSQSSFTFTPTADTTVTANFVPSKTLTMSQQGFGIAFVDSIAVPAAGASYKYADNTPALKATITWQPDPGHPSHVLTEWIVNGQAQPPVSPLVVTMDADQTVQAVFTSYLVTLSQSGNGTLTPPAGIIPVAANNNLLSISAVPDSGWEFDHWYIDNTTTMKTNPLALTVTADTTVEAFFLQVRTLTVATAGKGHLDTASGQYPDGTNLVLTATPDPNQLLVEWIVDGTPLPATSNTLSIVMNADRSVEAVFTSNLITLQVLGPGTTSPPAGIIPIVAGASQTISATPNAGAAFDHWTIDGVAQPGSTPTITITPTQDTTIVALFKAITYTLTLQATPAAGGTVAANPSNSSYTPGASVAITATPAQGYNFTNWTGDVTGIDVNSPSIQVTMDANKSLTANFTIETFTLTTAVSPPDSQGTSVTVDPPTGPYDYGTTVTLTAVSKLSTIYTFDHWGGDLNNSVNNPEQLVMNANKSVTAVFNVQQYTITAAASPPGAGTVSSNPQGPTYPAGSTVTLTATANSGYIFTNWTGDVTGIDVNSPTIQVPVDANKTLTAVFAVAVTLTTNVNPVGFGSVSADPPGPIYAIGTVVQLTAVPIAGYVLDNWTGDISDTAVVTHVTMSANRSVTANFVKGVTLTATVTPAGDGTITANPPGPTYKIGTTVQITANPSAGFMFVRWEGDASGTTPTTTVTMDANKTVQAVFAPLAYTLTVNASPSQGGTIASSPSGASYVPGTLVQLTATPATGFTFSQWQGDAAGTNPVVTVTMDANKTVTAVFTQQKFMLATSVSPAGAGTISPVPVQPADGYLYGTSVSLTAQAATGFAFDHWEGDAAGNTNPVTLTMNAAKTVKAVFTVKTYKITITTTPVGGGAVTTNPAQGPFAYGTPVTLTATPALGYSFAHWGGDVSGSQSPLTITIDGDKQVIAVFSRSVDTLTVNASPLNGGTINVTPMQAQYDGGTSITLTASPAAGYVFDHWEGGVTGSTNPVSFTIQDNTVVTAVFVKQTFTLDALALPSGGGSVTLDPATGPYPAGSAVTVTATPNTNNGYVFSHWEGDVSSSVNPLTITMDANKHISAVFTQQTYTLTTTASPLNGGTILANPLLTVYGSGAIVTLTATPAAGYLFSHWEGALTNADNPATLTIDANKTVTAVFVQAFALTLSISPAASGSVAVTPPDGPYPSGTVVTLTPSPAPGFAFNHWEGDLTGSAGPAQIVMNTAKNITAVFAQQTYTLTTVVTPTGGGAVAAAPGAPYSYGELVTLTATPAPGFVFDHWQNAVTGTTNPISLTMTGSQNVLAVFTRVGYALTLTSSPPEGGTVTLDPANGPYMSGVTVTLTPAPASGFVFDHWEGDLIGSDVPGSLVMNSDKAVTAVFNAAPCALTQFTRIFPANGSTLYVDPGAEAADLVLLAATDCPADTADVKFTMAALQADVTQPDNNNIYSAVAGSLAQLGFGQHSVIMTATGKFHPDTVIQQVISFNIVATTGTADADGNGLPDNIYSILQPGDAWYSVVTDPTTGARRVSVAIRWDYSGKADNPAAPVLSIQNPANPAAYITVSVPPDLLRAGESAVLIVRTASDLLTLFGLSGASVFGVDPGVLVTGGQYVDVAVISSTNGGAVYNELDAARVAANPLHFTMGGLQFRQNGAPSLFSHPSHAQNNAATGLQIVAWEGPWSTNGIAGLVRTDSALEADLTSLSTFAPFDTTLGAAQIGVSPSVYDYNFVTVGSSQDAPFTVTNLAATGGGQLVGEASVTAPFSIVGDATYDLAPGQSKQITVRFTPTAERDYSGSASFTGGGGVTVAISGRGYNSETGPSCPFSLSTGPTGGPGGSRGDLLLFALVALVFLTAGRVVRKAARIR